MDSSPPTIVPAMPHSPIDCLISPYFTLLQTPNGGRSLFAAVPIPANTLVHISNCPAAHVVYREFRKVVCAWCYECRDQGRREWGMTGGGNGRERFCGEACLGLWMAEGMRCSGLRDRVNMAIDVAARRMNKSKARPKQTQSLPGPDSIAKFDYGLEITQATLDAAWTAAASDSTKIIQLDEIELDMARFVSSALIQLCHGTTITSLATSDNNCSILSLQQNELPHTLQRPYILPTHIRVFQFLRAALSCILEMEAYISMADNGDNWIRKILSRDAGNSFGIWEQVYSETRNGGDPEMFGWGIWVDGSFFNHSRSSPLHYLYCCFHRRLIRLYPQHHKNTLETVSPLHYHTSYHCWRGTLHQLRRSRPRCQCTRRQKQDIEGALVFRMCM